MNTSIDLQRFYSTTIKAGLSTNSAIINGLSYTILEITGGNSNSYDTITINSITGSISTTSNTKPGIYEFYVRNTGSYNITSVSLTILGNGPIPCITQDSTVLTPTGYVKITELKINDLIITTGNREVPIKYIFTTIVEGNKITYPYIIEKSSIAPNYPPQTTLLSPDHLIKYENKWIHPRKCGKFKRDETKDIIIYYHIETPNYLTDNLFIDGGLEVESYGCNSKLYSNNQSINIKNIYPKISSPLSSTILVNTFLYNKKHISLIKRKTFVKNKNFCKK